jgi:hypothetical protein
MNLQRTGGTPGIVQAVWRWACVAALGLALVACAPARAAEAGHPVEWYEAFGLEHLLAEPFELATVDDIRRAMTMPWEDSYDVVPEGSPAGTEARTLDSCAAYLEVSDQRVRPRAATDWVWFMSTARVCQTARLIVAAEPAERSWLGDLVFDRSLPERLPWQVAMIISSGESDAIAASRPHARWSEVEVAPVTEFSSCGEHCGRYGDESGGQSVRLVARGDFNGDGIGDVILESNDWVIGGTYRAYRVFVLTRREAGGGIELLDDVDF